MSTPHRPRVYPPLVDIVGRGQVWPRMASKYGVENAIPPWKSSLDGLCDALDQASGTTCAPGPVERRDEEDRLAATTYADLPYPENQLVALAHTLLDRGVIDERELAERMAAVRSRLEA
ncbi:SH3-like domain-containing protein [Gordonia alkanivorans]|uniref:SH3-like domain-containing protein n=1 Tax=Gordonia alkanivorans TaxID=84096 RepID=UPI000FDDD19F|nr:SH3-like domain-containing protein [Gordonia alkanivorans]AZZ80470.1 thiocyanate hydrolase [Gordonia alkanivorans]MDH3047523.1 nitrile hydratase subunit beta [Gordonia alkanivorans]